MNCEKCGSRMVIISEPTVGILLYCANCHPDFDKLFMTLAINLEKKINQRIIELKKQWKNHLKKEGGSCYCMASDESCIPDVVRELKGLLKGAKT